MVKRISDINARFRAAGERILRYRWLLIGLFVVLNVVGFTGLPKIVFDSSYDGFFLDDDPCEIAQDAFEDTFGNNNFAAVLVEADDVFDPEVLGMIRRLGNEMERSIPYADEVLSITEFEATEAIRETLYVGSTAEVYDGVRIQALVPDEIPSDPAELERMRQLALSKPHCRNRLVSEDSRCTWVMLRLRAYPDTEVWQDTSSVEPDEMVGAALFSLINSERYQSDRYRLTPGGMPVSSFEKMELLREEAKQTLGLVLVLALVMLLVVLRSPAGVIVPVISTFSSIIVVYGIMGHLGIAINMVVMTIPIYLGLALSIGYSIHVFSFFRRHMRKTGHRRESILYAMEHASWPILFTAITTIGSMLSFYLVPITVTQWVGGTAASLVAVVYISVMTLTPALLSFGKDRPVQDDVKTHHRDRSEEWLASLGHWVMKHPAMLTAGFIATAVVMLSGFPMISVGIDSRTTMGIHVPFVARQYYIAETPVGSMYSYDITLEYSEADAIKNPDVLQRFDRFATQIAGQGEVKRVTSILDIIKDMNQVMHNGDPAYYRIPESQELVSNLMLLYEFQGGKEAERWTDMNYRTLRLMVEMKDFKTEVFEEELHAIDGLAQELFPDAQFGITGMAPKFARIINLIVRGEIASALAALGVIAILLMLVFRSVKAGLIGMVPNLAPPLVVGGIMGLAGAPLDMMTMTVIPILLGVAVDDTIHFINHMKYEFESTGSYDESVIRTFRTVGKAVFMTSVILASSFAVYLTSSMNHFSRLGMLSVAGIAAALLADYAMTPILVRWAKPFGPERSAGSERDDKTAGDVHIKETERIDTTV